MYARLIILLICIPVWHPSLAQTAYQIDLTHTRQQKITPLAFKGTNPYGTTLSVNDHYFERDGKPWYPLMGEFHYSRYPQQFWEEEIIKMKSAGLSVISTYIFWNVHENPRGRWNWTGIYNLRQFIELCQKHQMYVWIRIGPYDNAELLNGGLPQWIADLKGKRTNDSTYLAESFQLYKQIGRETRDLYFKDGGPIIGAQLENEYVIEDSNHIGTLKKMALQCKITPVFFSVTSNSVFHDDQKEVIPLQGAYPYRGWEKAGGSSSKDFLYGENQWILTDAIEKNYYNIHHYPMAMCEQGCGSQTTYANRFVVDPGIVEAHLQNQIGRGMNMIGYYMFQGGTQMPAFKSPDCPVSYDFQAPLSEFGFVQPSYRYLKILQHFIVDFGTDLAPMQVVYPAAPVRNELDTADLRYVVRMTNNSGFLFLNNAQVRVPMPDKIFRMNLKLADETIHLPRQPMRLKGGATAILPFNLSIRGAVLKYATAQPVSRFIWNHKQILFLMAVDGMQPELAFDAGTIANIKAEGWQINKSHGIIYLTPGKGREIQIRSATGQSSVIILLSREQAENSWRTTIDGREVMMISKADLMFDNGSIEFRQWNKPQFSFDIFPAVSGIAGTKIAAIRSPSAIFRRYTMRVPDVSLNLKMERDSLNKITVFQPSVLPAPLADIQLKIDYLGGSAEALAKGRILTDNLFNGLAWSFGLKRYMLNPEIGKIEFRALPWNEGITGVADSLVTKIKNTGTQISKITVIPQYRFVMKPPGR